ncbi:MAG: hypothetical protein ACYDC4_02765 [Candidatus Dormibacteria bacterium]
MDRTGFALRRLGGLCGIAGTVTIATAMLTSQTVAAAGNPNFEGILSAAAPTGFMTSPASYDISGGPVTVDFNVVATNLTGSAHTVALNFSAHHILTYNGANVSDGQPGQPGITFNGPGGTTQALMAGTQSFNETWGAHGSQTLSLTYTFDACGYYQLDVWAPFKAEGRDRATLASGFIRVLGCDATPTPTPTLTPTPSPTGGVGGATPTPDGGVLAATTSTPSTGAGGGLLTLGALLLIAGAGMLVIAARGRRVNI